MDGVGFARDPGAALLFLTDTVAQLAGIGLIVHGIVQSQTHVQRGPSVSTLALTVVPMAAGADAGATVVGRF